MTPKPIFLDAEHEKNRDYWRRYISKPGMREHIRQQQRKRYARNYKKWSSKPEVKRRKKANARSYLVLNPERKAAVDLAERHVPLGDKCEICGGTDRLQRHHDDYSKPLEVRTLCKKCHEKYHIEHKPKTRKDNINLTCAHCGTIKKVNMVPVRGRFRCIKCLKITIINNTTRCDNCSNYTSKDSKPFCGGYSYFFRPNFKKRQYHCEKQKPITPIIIEVRHRRSDKGMRKAINANHDTKKEPEK